MSSHKRQSRVKNGRRQRAQLNGFTLETRSGGGEGAVAWFGAGEGGEQGRHEEGQKGPEVGEDPAEVVAAGAEE